MRYLLIGIFCFLGTTKIIAQEDTVKYNNLFYLGLQGGYLLKNNSINKNPLYRFSNGMYAELNGGWRHKQWGWELALGYLTIKRDRERVSKYQVPAIDVLDAQTNPRLFENARDSGQIGDAVFTFSTNRHEYHEDLKGWYALTGPTYWLNFKKLQVQLNVKGGVLLRTFGYYFLNGNGISPDSITLSYNSFSATTTRPTLGKVSVTPNGTFTNYGMSQDLRASLPPLASLAQTGINEKAAFQFAGRAGVSAEYFISQRVSINAGAQYWFIPSPPMTGLDTLRGVVRHRRRSYAQPDTTTTLNFGLLLRNSYNDKNNLGFLSASIGLKIWLGSHKSKLDSRPEPVADIEASPKYLSVMVMNAADSTPAKDVTIKVYREGDADYIESITNEEGYADLAETLTPGDYIVVGTKNDVTTNEVKLTPIHFKTNDRAINIKLTL